MRHFHIQECLEGVCLVLCIMGGKSQPVFTSGRNLQNSVKLFGIFAGVFQISTWPRKRCVCAVELSQPFA